MKIDQLKAYRWIEAELARQHSIAESMQRLIEFCESECPHPDWRRLRSLPYDDLASMVRWIQKPFLEDTPERPLRGLWFGMYNPCRDGRTPSADIYVCGSERFYAVAGDNGWAVRPEWWPEGRYAESSVLAAVYSIAYRPGAPDEERKAALGVAAEYPLGLTYGALAVRALLERTSPALVLGSSETIGVAVGFDSGDFVLLGEFTSHGLKPIELASSAPVPLLEVVLEGLRSEEKNKFLLAVFDLARLGERAREAVPDLVRMANAEQQWKRQLALHKLAEIAPDEPCSKEAILRALDDSNPSVRRQALEAMISVKKLTPGDMARIKGMENDADEDVARWSEIALRNIRLRGAKEET